MARLLTILYCILGHAYLVYTSPYTLVYLQCYCRLYCTYTWTDMAWLYPTCTIEHGLTIPYLYHRAWVDRPIACDSPSCGDSRLSHLRDSSHSCHMEILLMELIEHLLGTKNEERYFIVEKIYLFQSPMRLNVHKGWKYKKCVFGWNKSRYGAGPKMVEKAVGSLQSGDWVPSTNFQASDWTHSPKFKQRWPDGSSHRYSVCTANKCVPLTWAELRTAQWEG